MAFVRLCGKKAAFITHNKEPYLEVNHLRGLSDGGPDRPEYVAALCPNCHRRAHYAIDADEFNRKIMKTIHEKEKQLLSGKALIKCLKKLLSQRDLISL